MCNRAAAGTPDCGLLSCGEIVPKNAIRAGVRTESWTVKRSGLEVRMYSREKVELFLLATEDGMGPTAVR